MERKVLVPGTTYCPVELAGTFEDSSFVATWASEQMAVELAMQSYLAALHHPLLLAIASERTRHPYQATSLAATEDPHIPER